MQNLVILSTVLNLILSNWGCAYANMTKVMSGGSTDSNTQPADPSGSSTNPENPGQRPKSPSADSGPSQPERKTTNTTSENATTSANKPVKGLKVVTDKGVGPGGAFTVFRPQKEGKYPLLLWGNATMAPGPAYTQLHEYVASHGFVVAAGAAVFTGKGEEMKSGLDWLQGPSNYASFIQKDAIGLYGHSQGAATAIAVAGGQSENIKSVVAIMPDCNFWVRACEDSVNKHTKALVISGGSDVFVPKATVEAKAFRPMTNAVYATIKGLDHFAWMPNSAEIFGAPVVAWFEASLKNIESSKKQINGEGCRVCGKDYTWTTKSKGRL